MKRSGFKRKQTVPLKRTRLRMRGVSDSSVLKEQIQSALREVVIKRDGGCVLRNYPETGACDKILQAEHLNSRSRTQTFAVSLLAVCLCRRHHIYWKPTHSLRYWQIIEEIIGEKRWELLQKVLKDYKTYKVDLKMGLIGLQQELKELNQSSYALEGNQREFYTTNPE